MALKTIRPDPEMSAVEMLGEAAILADLLHPNVVRVYDADIWRAPTGEIPFLTMEYVQGGTLASLLKREIRLDINDALNAMSQLLEGLSAAHGLRSPVLHRDLTPNNILVASEEPLIVKIGDFGLAARMDPATRLLRSAGTLRYQPPEASWGYTTEAGDVYGLALIFYELLTGAAAFPVSPNAGLATSADVASALREAHQQEPRPPSALRSEISEEIDEIVMTSLAKSPTSRFASALDFRDAINRISKGLPRPD